MAWHRRVTQQAFFILIFVLVATLGVAAWLGVSGNEILSTAVNAIVATVVSLLVTTLVFRAERKSAR